MENKLYQEVTYVKYTLFFKVTEESSPKNWRLNIFCRFWIRKSKNKAFKVFNDLFEILIMSPLKFSDDTFEVLELSL